MDSWRSNAAKARAVRLQRISSNKRLRIESNKASSHAVVVETNQQSLDVVATSSTIELTQINKKNSSVQFGSNPCNRINGSATDLITTNQFAPSPRILHPAFRSSNIDSSPLTASLHAFQPAIVSVPSNAVHIAGSNSSLFVDHLFVPVEVPVPVPVAVPILVPMHIDHSIPSDRETNSVSSFSNAAVDVSNVNSRSITSSPTVVSFMDSIKTNPGRIWLREECIVIIQCSFQLMSQLHFSMSNAAKFVASSARSYPKIIRMLSHFVRTGEILYCDRSASQERAVLTPVQQEKLRKELVRCQDKGKTVNARYIQSFLQFKFEITLTRARIYNELSIMYIKYRRIEEITPIDPIFQSKRVAKFILAYSNALKEEEAGTAVIVYTDESFIHNNHASNYTWCVGTNQLKRSRRNGRLVMIHCMTKHGLMFARRSDDDADLSKVTVNSEYIYLIDPKATNIDAAMKADRKGDKEAYHGNIDQVIWLTWAKHRCFSSIKALFEGKKMYLVLDNASFHNPRKEDWTATAAMTKNEFAAKLIENGVKSIEVERDSLDNNRNVLNTDGEPIKQTVTVTSETFNKRASAKEPYAPYVDELRKRWSSLLKERPELVRTITREMFDAEGFELLFTPPMNPNCQPIEKVWGLVKGRVADQYEVGRTVDETRNQLLNAFYGDRYEVERKKAASDRIANSVEPGPGISAVHCDLMIKKCQQWMQDFIKANPSFIQGTLMDCQPGPILMNNATLTAAEEVADAAREDAAQLLMHQREEDEARMHALMQCSGIELNANLMDLTDDSSRMSMSTSLQLSMDALKTSPIDRFELHPMFRSGEVRLHSH